MNERPPATTRGFSLASAWGDLAAWAALAGASLVVLWPLGLTNRVLAGVDALTYFTPYWTHRMAELRAGHLPLWNPYLFLGAPFLANPQAAVLYPLHWPLSWLTPSQALVWSALLHVWLAAGFTYTFARRSLRLSRAAALLAGLVFGLGGFTLARVENINQLNALAWLPASLWLADEVMGASTGASTGASGWRGRVRWGVALAAVLALQLLAGHTQTTFVNLVGLALWMVLRPDVRRTLRFWLSLLRRRRVLAGRAAGATLNTLALPAALLLALCLSAGQLIPTIELNGYGWRTGGLPYRQAVSFSLRPRLLLQSFLPPWRGGLAEAFGSEGYAEFVAYVGVVGLGLAVAGAGAALRARRRAGRRIAGAADGEQAADWTPSISLILLALAGAFLALGAYNPVYYVLWRFVPGFSLFRAPVRWLALYALGMAGLAGRGLDAALPRTAQAAPRRSWLAGAALILAVAELWLAARALPFAQATAPAGLSLRNAPAALLAAAADWPDAGRPRFLSLSDIRYDPGDLAELRAIQAGRLPEDAIERLVRAAKQMEVIAPNLPLSLHLPAVDGYDGGALPAKNYVNLENLFLPPERVLPDGRLREQLRVVPDGRLLDLTGVRFVITDKQRDLWADDVYYDLELPARIEPGGALTFDLSGDPYLSATSLGLVVEADPAGDGAALAAVAVEAEDGRAWVLPLPAGPTTRSAERPTRLRLPEAAQPHRIVIGRPTNAAGTFVLHGLSLIDERTGAHASVTVSPNGDFRRIHSGDVKVYARGGDLGRAWLVHGLWPAADDAAALGRLSQPDCDPRAEAVVVGAAGERAAGAAQSGEAVTIAAFEAERIVLQATVTAPATLVLADAFYPGWQAWVDGQPAPILRTNFMFRGVALEPGSHEVIFAYQPLAWRWGAAISAAALALAAIAIAAASRPGS